MIDFYHGVRDGSFTLSTFVQAWSCEFSNKLIMRKKDKKKDKRDRIWTGVLLDGSSTLSRKTKQQFLFYMYLPYFGWNWFNFIMLIRRKSKKNFIYFNYGCWTLLLWGEKIYVQCFRSNLFVQQTSVSPAAIPVSGKNIFIIFM